MLEVCSKCNVKPVYSKTWCKTCYGTELNSAWRKKNPEKDKIHRKNYQLRRRLGFFTRKPLTDEQKEKARVHMKEYYEANKEKLQYYGRQHYKDNRTSILIYENLGITRKMLEENPWMKEIIEVNNLRRELRKTIKEMRNEPRLG